ncbi:MAG: sialidase family protein [Acidimicrobiia bacterium]
MTRILVGTEKGAYVLADDGADWATTGPLFPGWKVTAFGQTADGTHLAAVGSNWFGIGVHRSRDLVEWEQIDRPPAWPEGAARTMEQVWTFHNVGEATWAGVAHAGLFTSHDQGVTWSAIEGLNEHPTRDEWQPGLGGLCAHRILSSGGQQWVAISAVGVFRSDDDGKTWAPKNRGIPAVNTADDAPPPEVGYCVHGIAHDVANPDRIWRQDHMGVFRSTDGGDNWLRIEEGLPAGFGFVMWRDADSGRLINVPLESSSNRVPVDGKLRAFASDDDGDTWHVAGSGWPDAPRFTGVLRGAFDGDQSGNFCFGTTGGSLWLTRDTGETWAELAPTFPRINAVRLVA